MKALGVAVVAAVLAVGCGGGDDEALSVRAGEPSVAPAAAGSAGPLTLSAQFPPKGDSTLADEEGRQWHVRRVTTFSTAPRIFPAAVPSGADTDLLTDDALAERMKPITLAVGENGSAWELVSAEANVGTVRAARAKDRAGMRMRVEPNGKVTEGLSMSTPRKRSEHVVGPFGLSQWANESSPLDPFGLADVARSPQQAPASGVDGVHGAYDERRWVTPSERYSWPHQAAVTLTVPTFSPHEPCSAIMIGRYTAVSAAHCFYHVPRHGGPSPSGAWFPTREWAVGLVYAGGPGGWREYYAYEPRFGCYRVTIPTGFITLNGAPSEDFAIIDFHGPGTCGLSPGAATAWVSPGIGSNNDYYQNSSQLQAYDSDFPLPPDLDSTYDYERPSMVTRSYPSHNVWTVPYEPWGLRSVIDVTGGASGGGLVQNIFSYYYGDPSWYWVGITTGADRLITYFRRLDWNMFYFLRDNCTEY